MAAIEDNAAPPLHALFQRRVRGDDALFRLADRLPNWNTRSASYRVASIRRWCTSPVTSTCFKSPIVRQWPR
jgi:hypothetical protein